MMHTNNAHTLDKIQASAAERATLHALAAEREVAIHIVGKGGFDITGTGVAHEKTMTAFVDGVFGKIPTSNRGIDSLVNPGRDKLSFVTVDLSPASMQELFGARSFVEKRIQYLFHGAFGEVRVRPRAAPHSCCCVLHVCPH